MAAQAPGGVPALSGQRAPWLLFGRLPSPPGVVAVLHAFAHALVDATGVRGGRQIGAGGALTGSA
eukprot:15447407-Alexandrium_andersonii.AAC.1